MYAVELISPEEKDRLYERYLPRLLYTRKCDINGCCIKLLTDQQRTKDRYEDNFYASSESVRSHGRLVVLSDETAGEVVRYDPLTKTAFLLNIDYYGWIKSIALALAGDILEDQHHTYHVHGAAIDIQGKGVSLIAPSKTGKTTHSWGLLRAREARLITDDWYFVRLSRRRPVAFGSEKNFYVEGDIGQVWTEYQDLVHRAEFDEKGRALVNVRWTVGQSGVLPMTTMYKIFLLKRDPQDPRKIREISTEEALSYLLKNDFCNPHQLVRDERKRGLRTDFFREFLGSCEVHMVNTAGTPQETQNAIKEALDKC